MGRRESCRSRPTVPVLAGVLLTGSDDGLTISGFDYEVSAEVRVAAEIASPGSVLVSGRLLSDITRALPAKPVDVSVEGTRVSLTCGSARFSLPTMAVEDYPTLPALPDETAVSSPRSVRRGHRPGAPLPPAAMTRLPMLTGIRVEISGEKVVLAATDRFPAGGSRADLVDASPPTSRPRCWCRPRRWPRPRRRVPTAPTCTCRWARAPRSARKACWVFAATASAAPRRLLDAEFPKFRQLLPAEHTAIATIGVAELTEAIKRVALVADRGAQVRMEFADDVLRLSAGADDVGRRRGRSSRRLLGRSADRSPSTRHTSRTASARIALGARDVRFHDT